MHLWLLQSKLNERCLEKINNFLFYVNDQQSIHLLAAFEKLQVSLWWAKSQSIEKQMFLITCIEAQLLLNIAKICLALASSLR